MAQVLIPIADGSEDIEAVTMIDVLRRAGAEVTVASVADGGRLDVTCARGTRVTADTHIDACAEDQWDLVVLPGGLPGAEHLRDCAQLITIVRRQKQAGRLFGAICAAPQVALAHHGLLDDRTATGHPGFRDKLPKASAERVVRDGNCLTSQAPGTALEYSLALVEALFGTDLRNEVAAPMAVAASA